MTAKRVKGRAYRFTCLSKAGPTFLYLPPTPAAANQVPNVVDFHSDRNVGFYGVTRRCCGWVRTGLGMSNIRALSVEEGVHGKIMGPGGPLLVLHRTASSGELAGCVHRRKVPVHALVPPDFFDQALAHVCITKPPAVRRRKRQHGGGVSEAHFQHVPYSIGVAATESIAARRSSRSCIRSPEQGRR